MERQDGTFSDPETIYVPVFPKTGAPIPHLMIFKQLDLVRS